VNADNTVGAKPGDQVESVEFVELFEEVEEKFYEDQNTNKEIVVLYGCHGDGSAVRSTDIRRTKSLTQWLIINN